VSRPFEILVAGAGIGGLCVALILARCSHADKLRLVLADAGDRPIFDRSDVLDLRVSAISAGSAALLDTHGAWRHIGSERHAPFDHMRVWDAAGDPEGAASLCFDAEEFAVPHLGYIVENRLLQHALLEALEAFDVETRFGAKVLAVDFTASRPRVSFGGGTTEAVDLVIAADGSASPLRQHAGLPAREHAYRQDAFVAHFRTARPHRGTAWQRFLPTGPLGLLPLADGRVSAIWSTSPDSAAAAMAMSDAELGRTMTDASDAVLGELVPDSERARFALVARHAREYVRQGLALMGDAAHTVHPLAGQGANLGIADAEVLARVIDDALARREHPADRPVLRRYERARKGHNAVMMHFLTGLNRLFASDSAIPGELRRSGMAIFNRSGPIRKAMAAIALGGAAGK
jgi:2-polyprenylphenol 6-hydroxylase